MVVCQYGERRARTITADGGVSIWREACTYENSRWWCVKMANGVHMVRWTARLQFLLLTGFSFAVILKLFVVLLSPLNHMTQWCLKCGPRPLPYIIIECTASRRWGAHPVSCKVGTGSYPGVKCGRGVLLTTHPLLVPRSWNSYTPTHPPDHTGPVTGTLYLFTVCVCVCVCVVCLCVCIYISHIRTVHLDIIKVFIFTNWRTSELS